MESKKYKYKSINFASKNIKILVKQNENNGRKYLSIYYSTIDHRPWNIETFNNIIKVVTQKIYIFHDFSFIFLFFNGEILYQCLTANKSLVVLVVEK